MAQTVHLHRILSADPEKVYRAFLDPEAIVKWLPPDGFTAKIHSMETKVGGHYKMSFTNFSTGHSHTFGGEYVELEPQTKIRYTDRFDDPNMPDEIQVTVTLKKIICGTELQITQENIPIQIPVEMCYLGWQQSLKNLAQLVEPTIPD